MDRFGQRLDMDQFGQQSLPHAGMDSRRAATMNTRSPFAAAAPRRPFTSFSGDSDSFFSPNNSVGGIPFGNEANNICGPTEDSQQPPSAYQYNSTLIDHQSSTYDDDPYVNTTGAPYYQYQGLPTVDSFPEQFQLFELPRDVRTRQAVRPSDALMSQYQFKMANTTTNTPQHKDLSDKEPAQRAHSTNVQGLSLTGSVVGDQQAATYASSSSAFAAAKVNKRAQFEHVSKSAQTSEADRAKKFRKTSKAGKASRFVVPTPAVDEEGEEASEEENDDDEEAFVWIFNSIAEVKLKEFERAQLSRDALRTYDVNKYVNNNRMQKRLVKQIVAALSGEYQKTPAGGEKFTKEERAAEWKRYQTDHRDDVQETLEKPNGPEPAQRSAWLLVEALLEAHRLGIRKFKNSGTDTKLIFSARATACIKVLTEMPMLRENILKGIDIHSIVSNPEGAKKLKIQNLWVNYGKKLVNGTQGRRKRSKKAAALSDEEQENDQDKSEGVATAGEGNGVGEEGAVAGAISNLGDSEAEGGDGEIEQGRVAVQPGLSAMKGQKRKRNSS